MTALTSIRIDRFEPSRADDLNPIYVEGLRELIAKFLSDKDLANLSSTCRPMHAALLKDHLWKDRLIQINIPELSNIDPRATQLYSKYARYFNHSYVYEQGATQFSAFVYSHLNSEPPSTRETPLMLFHLAMGVCATFSDLPPLVRGAALYSIKLPIGYFLKVTGASRLIGGNLNLLRKKIRYSVCFKPLEKMYIKKEKDHAA